MLSLVLLFLVNFTMPLTSVLTGFVDRLYRYGDTRKDYAEVESEEGADPYRELAARDQVMT